MSPMMVGGGCPSRRTPRSSLLTMAILIVLSIPIVLIVMTLPRVAAGRATYRGDQLFVSLGRIPWSSNGPARRRRRPFTDIGGVGCRTNSGSSTATKTPPPPTTTTAAARGDTEGLCERAAISSFDAIASFKPRLMARLATCLMDEPFFPKKDGQDNSNDDSWRGFLRRIPNMRGLGRTSTFAPSSAETLSEASASGTTTTTTTMSSDALCHALTQPLIPESVWVQQTGNEFMDHAADMLPALALMGEAVARHDGTNEWLTWKANRSNKNTDDDNADETAINVWTGRAVPEGCYGGQLPWIKTRSIVPLSVDEMVDLLLDSSRVQTYNAWSLGRRDCWVRNARTKIVKNKVQPPLGSKPMLSTTLLHAQPSSSSETSSDGSMVVVSRAVRGISFAEPDDEAAGVSEMLLGVNLLEPIGEESCRLTAVTHVYSPGVPLMLAERVGVTSAIKFVKDMRKLNMPVGSPP